MFTHEIQLLSRQKGDFHFHRNAALSVDISGQIGFRSYFFAGRRSLVILLENREDVDQVLSALPRYAAVSVREVHGGISAEDSSSASSAA